MTKDSSPSIPRLKRWAFSADALVTQDMYVKFDNNWVTLKHYNLRDTGISDVDIAVFESSNIKSPSHPISLSSGGIALAQDTYFLGFPLGYDNGYITNSIHKFPLPFVKKACFCGLVKSFSGMFVYLLDGINNRGFSGGPALTVDCKGDITVFGVVHGYVYEKRPIKQNKVETGYTFEENTGLVMVYPIEKAIEAITGRISA